MKKGSGGGRRNTRRSSAAALLDTPPPVTSSPPPSPLPPKSTLHNNSNKRTRKTTTSAAKAAASVIGSPTPVAAAKTESTAVASIPDLKSLVSSRLQDLKQHIGRSHTEILKNCDSAHSRLHKRFKIQSQAYQQMLDEADKEYKKMAQRTNESREAMMASYAEFMADAQASASRACKTSIAELSQSFEKKIDALNIHMGFEPSSCYVSVSYTTV